MSTWMTQTTCSGAPNAVLDLLTEPSAIARWSPLPFTLVGFTGTRLRAGDRVRVRGDLAGRVAEFVVQVGEAEDGRLSLTAEGPIRIDVEYVVSAAPSGSTLRASIGVAGTGLVGRILARATDALLAAGALRAALAHIASEFEPAPELEPALAA